MRAHPPRARTPIVPILALTLLAGGPLACDKSSDEAPSAPAPSPAAAQPHAAPTQNPLTSGTTAPTQAPPPMPAATAPPTTTTTLDGGTRIEADGVSFVVPPTWEREAVTSSMRAAQYKVPAPDAEGEEGTFVVFRGIGGSPDDNIQRWIGQLTDKAAPPERATINVGEGITVHTVSMVGTYSVGTMMGGTGNPEPDTMFLGAVITGGPAELPVFFRLTGPRTTVEPRVDEWNAVLASLDRAGAQ